MIYLVASIITTLVMIWLSSHDFHKQPKKTVKHTMKRLQPRARNGRFLPLELSYVMPSFRQVSEIKLVRLA
jgi:hypothetical protein